MTGRQDPEAVARIGLRLALRKAQAEAGDITLVFCDESEALTHPDLAQALRHAHISLGSRLAAQRIL